MAKRTNEQSTQDPTRRLRVRWVEVELDGADSTIAEALRTVERLRRPAIEAIPPTKRIVSTPVSTGASEAPAQDATLFDDDAQDAPSTVRSEPVGENGSDGAVIEAPRKRRGEGGPKDRNSGIRLIGDIDFVPANGKSLKQLFVEKSPESDMDVILVIVYFLQETVKVPSIGPGHVLTGLKHVAKPVPKDLKQTIRNMKSQKAWLNFTDIESVRLTTEGENHVEHELGRTGGDNGSD